MDEFAIVAVPFAGTSIGAALVFCFRSKMNRSMERLLLGFASGVMMAASVWSLLIPSIEMAEKQGKSPWLPAAAGFLTGVVFLLLLDRLVSYLQRGAGHTKGGRKKEGQGRLAQKITTRKDGTGQGEKTERYREVIMLVLAVALHNLPEGMAVGVALAGAMAENTGITMTGAMLLSIGIAIQNLPEGAIISIPLRSQGTSRLKAFGYGVLSGAVEPIGAVITILLAEQIIPLLPGLLAFAAGAMMYVAAGELIPGACAGEKGELGTVSMAAGFVLMMVLDVTL